MKPGKKMLVPVIFSKDTMDNINYAVRLASDLEFDEVILIHIIDRFRDKKKREWQTESIHQTIEEYLQEREEHACGMMKNYISMLEGKYQELPVAINYEIGVGLYTEKIIEKTYTDQVSMILLSKDKTGKTKNLVLDNINEIIKRVKCPVWVIPSGAMYQPSKHVVYNSDYNENDFITIKKLTNITSTLKSNLTVLHVVNQMGNEEEQKEKGMVNLLSTMIDSQNIEVMTVGRKGETVAESIDNYANHYERDLIVVYKQHYGIIKEIFADKTKQLIKKTEKPVLVYQ